MSSDEDVFVCDHCIDIFLSKSALASHVKKEHNVIDVIPSTEDKIEVKDESETPQHLSKKSVERKKFKKKKKQKDKGREKDKENKNYRDKEVNRDKSKDRREKSRGSEKELNRNRDKCRDSHREKDFTPKVKVRRVDDRQTYEEKDRTRNGNFGCEEKTVSHKSQVRPRSSSSSDDEEKNRRKAEEAKTKWQKKEDEAKGKVAKLNRTDSVEFYKFIASDDEAPTKMKSNSKKIKLDYLTSDKSKADLLAKPSVDKKTTFPLQGTVAAHDNVDGPECPKCKQICKDNSNLRNHVLSHYYHVFYDILPTCKPFECPICGNSSRDRITMVRHYAFTHKKFFEMTDVTPEDLAGFGSGASRGPSAKKKEERQQDVIQNSISDDDDDVIKQMKERISGYSNPNVDRFKAKQTYRENDEKSPKKHKHKKHKHKEHKDKKHSKKEKRKDREKDRDREVSNPCSSLHEVMTPDLTSSELLKARSVGSNVDCGEDRDESKYTSTVVQAIINAHVPIAPVYPLPHIVPTDVDKFPDEENDDDLEDLPMPVFAD